MAGSSDGDGAATDGSRLRLVIVDDREVVREGLVAALSHDDRFTIVGAASTGEGAVDLARQQRPDVAIIDMRLPDMPGHDLCRALRRLLPDINVIALSSYLTED